MCRWLCCRPKDEEEDYYSKFYLVKDKSKSGRLPQPIVNRNENLYVDNQETKNNNYDLTITKTLVSPPSGSPVSSKSLSPKGSGAKVTPGYEETTHFRLIKQTTSTTKTKIKESHRRPSEDFSTHRLYVSNLAIDMTIPELNEVFPGNSNILMRRSKRRGTTAVVEYQDPADCEAAYKRVKGTTISGMILVVSPKLRHEILLD